MFKRIVVGLDGSPREPGVLAQAAEFAARCGGELHLCRAMQVPVSIPAIAWSLKGPEFEEFLVEHGLSELEHSRGDIPETTVCTRWCRIGQPADVLCAIAEELQADLIVIGSHGYDRVDRILGTTAAKIANRAPCSVTVVRSRACDL